DEHRDHDVEQPHGEADGEQRDEHRLGLASEVPIEADEAGGWHRLRIGQAGDLHPSFEQAEHYVHPTRSRAEPGGSRALKDKGNCRVAAELAGLRVATVATG